MIFSQVKIPADSCHVQIYPEGQRNPHPQSSFGIRLPYVSTVSCYSYGLTLLVSGSELDHRPRLNDIYLPYNQQLTHTTLSLPYTNNTLQPMFR